MDGNMFVKTVMPTVYVREDAAWIQEQLSALPHSARGTIAHKYAEAYQTAWDEEPVSYRQENAARKAANQRLRLYMVRCFRSSVGFTDLPPLAGK